MSQHKSKERHAGMTLAQRLQMEGSGVVRAASYLVDERMAGWMTIKLPRFDGDKVGQSYLALIFDEKFWEMKDNILLLKIGRVNEPDKIDEITAEQSGDVSESDGGGHEDK